MKPLLPPADPRRPVHTALRVFLTVFASLWAVAISIPAINRFLLHRPYPANTFLFNPAARFWDFTVFAPRFAEWGHGDRFFTIGGFPFTYPAPVLLCQLAYHKLAASPLFAYLCTILLLAIAGGLLAAMAVPRESPVRRLAASAILAISIASYPLFYLLDRGNLEGFVWMAAAIGMLLYLRRNFAAAAVFIGLAASMKIFPVLLLGLFLRKGRYRHFAVGLAAAAAFTVGALRLVAPSVSAGAQRIAFGMNYFRGIQVFEYRPAEIGFDHSLFAVLKQAMHFFVRPIPELNALLPGVYLVYAAVSIAFTVTLYFARVRRLPLLNQFLALTALSVTLPFISYDYTLVHMTLPCMALILFLAQDAAPGRVPVTYRQMLALLLPFAVILTPQSYLLSGVLGFSGQVKAAALLSLAAAALMVRMPSSLFGDLPASTRAAYYLPWRGVRARPSQLPQPRQSPRNEDRVGHPLEH